MVEYSLTSELISRLAAAARPETEEESLYYYLDVADTLGPMMAFLLRRECAEEIPFAKIGIPKFDASQCVPQRGEVWVLFCFKDLFRDKANATTPIRRDGFPLILEWRRGTQDSPLLSSAFRALADLTRRQLEVEGWGLHPSYSRYCDKIDFSDPSLFADSDNVNNVASAYGSILAGLHCAKTGRFPSVWPFPTLQWDPTLGCIAGVAGLREKLAVARDFGANVFTVAKGQERLIAELQGTLNIGTKQLSVYGVRRTSDFEKLASDIAFGAERRKKSWRRLLTAALVPLIVLAFGVGAFYWETNRSVFRYYRSSEQLWGQDHGIERIDRSDIGEDGAYEFEYRGYRHTDAGWERKLRRVRRVDSRGVAQPFVFCFNSLKVGIDKQVEHEALIYCSQLIGRDYDYDVKGGIVAISNVNPDGECIGRLVCLDGKTCLCGDDYYDMEYRRFRSLGCGTSTDYDKLYVAFDAQGHVERIADGDGTGRFAVYHLNSAGYSDEVSFRTKTGQLTTNEEGISRIETVFYANGLPAARYYYGVDNSRVLGLEAKISGVTNVYDSAGNKIWCANLGLEDQIVDDILGTAATKFEYDSLGRCIYAMGLSAKGESSLPKNVRGDAVAVKYEYDDVHGFLRLQKYVNANDEAATVDGVSIRTFDYDYDSTGSGVVRERARLYDKDEKLIGGFDEEFDRCGNVTKHTDIGNDGTPIVNDQGVATIVKEYDTSRRVIYEARLDLKGDVVPVNDNGFLVKCTRIKYDSLPFLVKEYEDSEGRTVRITEHESFGLCARECFNSEGQRMSGPFGWARCIVERNAAGWVTEGRYENEDGKLVNDRRDGVAKFICDYDVTTDGIVVRVTCKNEKGVECNNRAGWCNVCLCYDKKQNLISVEVRNTKGEGTFNCFREKVSKAHFSYYEDGKIKSLWGTDLEGNLISITNNGGVVIFLEYDENGTIKRVIERSCSGEVVRIIEDPLGNPEVRSSIRRIDLFTAIFRFRTNYLECFNGYDQQMIDELVVLQESDTSPGACP